MDPHLLGVLLGLLFGLLFGLFSGAIFAWHYGVKEVGPREYLRGYEEGENATVQTRKKSENGAHTWVVNKMKAVHQEEINKAEDKSDLSPRSTVFYLVSYFSKGTFHNRIIGLGTGFDETLNWLERVSKGKLRFTGIMLYDHDNRIHQQAAMEQTRRIGQDGEPPILRPVLLNLVSREVRHEFRSALKTQLPESGMEPADSARTTLMQTSSENTD